MTQRDPILGRRKAGAARASTKPTLKTIAKMSGLAVPTVSRALSDAPDIGADTKKLVRRIATEIGYVPNRAGVRLRTGRTNVISLVLSTEHDMMNHTARLISAIAGQFQSTQFHMIVTPFFPSDDPMKPIRYIVESASADGIIFNQTQPEDPRVDFLMARGFPFATHGRDIWADQHPYFDYDNIVFGRHGVRRLAARGRRRLLVVAPPMAQNYAQNIRDGVMAEAAAQGLSVRILEGATSDSSSDEVRSAVAAALTTEPAIDGLICSSTAATMAAVAALESRGRVVADDIDVFAKEAIPFLNLFRPGIIAVREDVARAGEFLARAVMQAVRNPELPPMQGLEVLQDDDTNERQDV
ncbi:MAG: LacI family DNA-binding transcriptional regulator [Limimaricola sp.]|uniref:LacI family transcriptional regulator n=1 Tax=Limimaricola sp. TaxID=2211665 RepID=UPI001D3566E3|nr:LacI family transcriptional regulator [Limimaricola sp.]MBI1418828.1 LacI family DNA-binding transcriptional regulator [Limimaricola sp.]